MPKDSLLRPFSAPSTVDQNRGRAVGCAGLHWHHRDVDEVPTMTSDIGDDELVSLSKAEDPQGLTAKEAARLKLAALKRGEP